MKRIALNGRFSYALQPTGTQTVAFHLFDAILRLPRDFEVVVFADPAFPGVVEWGTLAGVRLVSVPFHRWSRSRAQLWEQLVFPLRCRREGCRVAHHPMNTSPVFSWGVKSIVTLHDLNFLLHPAWYTRSFRLAYQVCALPGLRRADMVVTISDCVKETARRTLSLSPTRSERVYNGVKAMQSGHSLAPGEAPYIICVGSLQPHKNLRRILRVFRVLRREYPQLELRIVGRRQAHFVEESELKELLETSGVSFLGYLPESELATAYQNAVFFAFPSLEEGFGLPVLEAMSLGTPVLTSRLSCLPEIAGGCARLVDPFSETEMEEAMREMLAWPEAIKMQVSEKGRAWARKFTWDAAARQYVKIYAKVAEWD